MNTRLERAMSGFTDRLSRFCRVIWVSILRYGRDGHSDRAVTLTYYTLFSIVPIAALLFGVAKGFDLEARLRQVLSEHLYQHEELLKRLYQFVDTTLAQASGGLVAGIGVIALIWTVTWLAASIESSFNAVWERPKRRNIVRKVSDYISVMLITPVLLVAMSSAGVLARNVLEDFAMKLPNLGGTVTWTVAAIIALTPLAITILLFSAMYFWAPSAKVKLRSALIAGVIAGVLFQLLQDGFIYLQKSIFTYNRIYGSFAALPLFLTWLKISWQLTLFGAEVGFVDQNIDSGKFDIDPIGSVSVFDRNARRLELAGYIYRRFSDNKGSTSREQLTERFSLTAAETEIELDCLVSSGVILRTEEEESSALSYTPARNTADFTVSDCLDMVEHSGLSHTVSHSGAEEILKAFEIERKKFSADRLLRDVL